MGKRILIVDDEPAILRMVEALLVRKGHKVDMAKNGEEGLQAARRHRPDLVITDVLMPEMDGWAFVRQLRAHKELTLVPVIFLTALNTAKDRVLGFRLGADDYLPKPFHLEELEIRVERVLRRADQLNRQVVETSAVGLRGSLEHIGTSSLLTILEMERKSGVLVIKTAKKTGRVFLREGRALDAFFDGSPEPRGAEAIYEMLTWTTGRFEFSYLEVEMEDNIRTSTTHLLMEGARLIDEASQGGEF
jgi:DNA-binding response OmpR family regulator